MSLDSTPSRTSSASRGSPALRIAQVGYGEVGTIFGAALARSGLATVAAFDILAADAAWAARERERASRDGVRLAAALADALQDADLVIGAVTAASSRQAAGQVAALCPKDAFVLDVSSASPRTKSECARVVNDAGGRYVEGAIMTAVPPYGLRVPMLLGGPHAETLAPTLARLGFDAKVGSPEYGVVSAIKLCRSVFIKGMEALAVEGLLAARRYGVEREVLASLAETFPGMDWETQASYFWKRVVQHGRRRAEEMREAAATVEDAGFPSRMAVAAAEVQAWMAQRRAAGAFAGTPKDATWSELADAIPRGDAASAD